jgi:peroxiredoxin Q/BCP
MLEIGQEVPDFELLNQEGQPVKLSNFRGQRVVMFAFPRANTGGCTRQACGFRDQFPHITAANAVILGISNDLPPELKSWHDTYEMQYDLLSDPEKQVINAMGAGDNTVLGVVTRDGAKRSYWVIDENGKLIDMEIGVSPEDSVEKALQALGV